MPLILGTNSIKDTGYNVDNSLRFNSASDDNLSRTPSSAGNRRTFTISVWVKRANLGGTQMIIDARTDSNNNDNLSFQGSDDLQAKIKIGGSTTKIQTNRLFRDVSAWYHIVWSVDTTQATASNRSKLYINGVEETSLSSSTYPTQNADTLFNNTTEHQIGSRVADTTQDYSGYMSEFVMIDGQALAPTSFGEFDEDSGIWKPIDVSGLTFGTNGFYLDFEDSSSLGNDAAGSNNFTVNNLTAIDQSTDTCTNNFATLNALAKGGNATFSEGNLKCTTGAYSSPSVTYTTSTSTIGVSTGKWYWEYKLPASGLNYVLYGITSVEFDARNTDVMTNFKTSYAKTAYANEFRYNTAGGAYSTDTTGFSTDSTGDIVKIALDLDNNFIYVGNGSSWFNSGDPTSGSSGTGASKSVVAGLTYFPMIISLDNSMEINFGSPSYSESGGNSDGNGYGNFNQPVPSGYYALNTKNLAEYG